MDSNVKHFDNAVSTGKSLSEALIFASTNPQYDDRLFIDLQLLTQKNTNSEHVMYKNCFECQNKKTIFVHNMFSTCIFLVLKSGINEQSVVILWVN